jgi:hypothetical protein
MAPSRKSFSFYGEKDDFFAKLQDFAAYKRKRNHEIYARWVFKPESGTLNTFSLDNKEERIILLISTDRAVFREGLIFWLTESQKLDDYAQSLSQEMTKYMARRRK